MAYNTLKGKVNFSNSSTGSIESMVDDYSTQTIAGVKTFSSTVSASAFYDTTTGDPLAAAALTAIASDGAARIIVSDGDGTATCYSNLTYDGTTLTASVSGSAAALTGIPLEPYKVSGQLSASNVYFGDGLQDSSNKLAAQAGDSISVGAGGIAVDLATTGGLAHDAGKLKVSPNDATTKASTSDNDMFIIADSDASNATKKITATVLGTYMQNALTFTAPGGSDAQLQYKNGSAFAGSSNLTFNTDTLTTVNVSASGHVSSSLFVGNGSGLTNVNAALVPAGVDTNVQFNSGSTFSGSNNLNFNYDAATPVLQITGDLSASNDFAVGRDSLFGRDTTVMRNVITYGNVSASLNISASNFYGSGQELTDLPIGNYTANRLVFCGAATNTLDAFNGLTWANPTLSVPGTVSATNVSASGHVSSSLFVGNGSGLTNLPASDPFPYTGNVAITGTLTTTDDINLLDDKKLNLGDSADAVIEFDSGIGRLAISGSATGIELMGGSISMDYPGGTVVSGTAGGAGSFLALNSSHQVVVATPAGGGGGSPGGSANQIQINDGLGNFAGTTALTWNSPRLVVTGTIDISGSLTKLGHLQLGRGTDQNLLIDVSNPQVRPSTGVRDVVALTSLTPTTTPIFVVEWDDTVRLDDSHYSSSATGIVVTETGDYKLSYSLNYAQDTPNNARSNMKSFATVNFSGSAPTTGSAVIVPFSHAYCYLRGDGGTNWGGDSGGNATTRFGTGQCTTIMSASEGDTINLACQFFGGATSGDFDVKLLANQSWITLEKI